ncbi:MAG: molybdopterin-guanine dinucleotide biosynthesis protein B [Candidatus Brocadiia bacterium]
MATQRFHTPVIAVSGHSGSGKTSLIERLTARLIERGLRVAVVKHCTHRIEADTAGKDSDRLFRAGADVLAAGPSEAFARCHVPDMPLPEAVRRVAAGCDVCFAEGYRGSDLPRIWVGASEEACAEGVLLTVTDVAEQVDAAESAVWEYLERAHRELPAVGLILMGAPASRPGSPAGQSVMKRLIGALAPHTERVFAATDGPLPAELAEVPRMEGAPGAKGPVAHLLSATRWRPDARWVVLSPDLLPADASAVEWLLSQIALGKDAVMPRRGSEAPCEPLFAVYEPTCRPHLEGAALRGVWSLRDALAGARVAEPLAPPALREFWTRPESPGR